MADLEGSHRHRLLEQLQALERVADIILIDCGAGISSNVMGFAASASTVVVTTTPEPTAITDGYGMIKSLLSHAPQMNVNLVVNMAYDANEGAGVYGRINRVCRTFLHRTIEFGGTIPTDAAVPIAVRQRVPFVLHAPDSNATAMIRRIAANLAGFDDSEFASESTNEPRSGFFGRLAKWLGIIEEIDES
jgi:flagellar biosynthesis protein FlhG